MSVLDNEISTIISIECKNCVLHCTSEHNKILEENAKLEEEIKQLKTQLATVQVEKLTLEQSKRAHLVIGQGGLEAIEKCDLLIENRSLKALNINLQMMINELKAKNVQLNYRVSQLEENMTSMAQRLYEYAPISFRLAIEQLINQRYESENLKTGYLKDLRQYFSSFVHHSASNTIDADTEEMTNWVNATLLGKSSLDHSYKFRGSQKQITIKLDKPALKEIIDFCVAEQKKKDEEEQKQERTD